MLDFMEFPNGSDAGDNVEQSFDSPEAAVDSLVGLFSDEEDNQSPEPQPKRKAKQPDPVSDEDETVDAAPAGDEAPEEVDEDAAPDPEDESEQDEDEAPDDSEEAPPTFKVKVDGQEVEVTLDELTKGYSRQQDYTRKTQALAEDRKRISEEARTLREAREQTAVRLAQLQQALTDLTPEEPDWSALAQSDPTEYAAAREQWDQHKARMAQINAAREQAYQQALEARQAEMADYLEQERTKLVAALPEWTDAEVAKREKGELAEYAKGLGYTDEQLGQVYDHRLLVILRKAMLHDRAAKARTELQKKAREKVVNASRVVAPGTPTNKSTRKATEARKRIERLKKTGSIDDGAASIRSLLGDDI